MINKATDEFIEWCAKDTASARLQRSVAQGLVGVACAAVAYYLTGNGVVSVIVTPSVMALLAPIQKAIGNKGEVD